jgi:hypothetical protein
MMAQCRRTPAADSAQELDKRRVRRHFAQRLAVEPLDAQIAPKGQHGRPVGPVGSCRTATRGTPTVGAQRLVTGITRPGSGRP